MCHEEHSVSVVVCVWGGGQGSLRCEGREGGTGRGSWNRDWRHLVIIPHLRSNLDFFRTHSPPGLLFYVLFLSSPSCANLSYILHWHVFPGLVLLLIPLVLENQTKHDTALHHLAWWCHDIINTPAKTAPPSSRHVSGIGEPMGRCVCECKSVTFFGGWVVTGHVFKTPLRVVKLNQTVQHRSWVWMGGLCLGTVHSLSFHNQVHPSGSSIHGRGVAIRMVGACGLRC